jgi:murein DD-endopeptidase MepM/ murein hydrolase activator NlpD
MGGRRDFGKISQQHPEMTAKSEIRNPKSEGNPKCEVSSGLRISDFGFRISSWPSAFGFLVLLLALAPVGCAVPGALPGGARANACLAPAPGKAVKVFTKKEGDVTRFYVENNELCEITMTFEMALVNLKAEKQLPATITFPMGQVTEAFALSPIRPGAQWDYSYTSYYRLGGNGARHDDSYAYELPYCPGAAYEVTQGFDGAFSHKGANRYAVDWKMAEGTLVRAARGGTVVRVKDDSSLGGPVARFDPYNNYVLIRHDDGTLGYYCHLRKAGCVVKPGQAVVVGQAIAHSGNTGFSSGPHLHFCVFKTKNGRERESVPLRFKSDAGDSIIPIQGRSYRAGPLTPAAGPAPLPSLALRATPPGFEPPLQLASRRPNSSPANVAP